MNRLSAILLLSLFIFHQLGYYFFYVASKYQINIDWEQKLEKEFLLEQDFKYMALPVSYPYQHDQALYESVNESMEFGGKYYRVIKKRYQNDTLHIVYVNDFKTQHLKQSFKDWINTIYQEKNPDSKRQIVLCSFDKNYYSNENLIEFCLPEPARVEYKDLYSLNYSYLFLFAPEHPPKYNLPYAFA